MRRSLQEFLAVPLLMVLGFVVLAIVTVVLDRNTAAWLQPARRALSTLAPPQENQSMLRTVAPGILTLMSMTFLLLLTLVHRMADVFTWVVVEQFMLRRTNQAFFGYVAGLSAYYVVIVAATNPQQAVFSTVVALVLSVIALAGLVTFGYLVLDQLRPPSVVERIVELTIATRTDQLSWLRRVRQESRLGQLPATTVHAECSGYLVEIDLDVLSRAFGSLTAAAEVEFCAVLGSHTVAGSELAIVRAENTTERDRLAAAVLDALRCGRERQLAREPAYGVHQLSSIGWAAATQRDPEAALVAVDGLHTLLAQWAEEAASTEPISDGERLPVVYRDTTMAEVLFSLASIAVGAAEGGQHQTCAQVLNVFAMALPQLSADHQRIATRQLRHVLPTATSHPLTAELERALAGLGGVLANNGSSELAAHLSRVESQLSDRQ